MGKNRPTIRFVFLIHLRGSLQRLDLIPDTINPVLRICLIAEMPYRLERALKSRFSSAKEARETIRRKDGDRAAWVNTLFSKQDP